MSVMNDGASIFVAGFQKIGHYWYFFIPIIVIAIIGGIVYLIKKIKSKNTQWTHKLIVRRSLENNLLSKPDVIRMRRFPLIKGVEIFELERPLLGGLLFPELASYTGLNEYSIVLDKSNRIYTNEGEYFNPDKNATFVSGRHAEIDLGRRDLKTKFQDMHKVSKRVQWAGIIKAAAWILFLVVGMILGLKGIQEWGDAQKQHTETARAEAQAMNNLAKAIDTIEATVNTQQLEISGYLKQLHNTTNLRPLLGES